MKTANGDETRLNRDKPVLVRFIHQWDLQILVIPSLILILIFSYIPMYGIIMAFQEYKLGEKLGFSQWVGLKQFAYLFAEPAFPRVLRNTLVISGLKILINFPIPIIFAVMINELRAKRFKKVVQTVSYLPHFISWVVCATLMFDMFSTDGGAINELLKWMGITESGIPFFNRANYFWGMTVATDLWKELGWNSIIFIAAIAGVDIQLYEAADIDGATRLQKVWYITIQTIKPTIIILLIFTVGGMLNANFDQNMMLTNQMSNAQLRETGDVIDTFVYRFGLQQMRYSFATAASLFKTIINFALLLVTNHIAGKLGDTALL
jgi:putative aldouronate transport system permease protein